MVRPFNPLSPLPFFLPVTQNYHESPILDLANLFVADAPMKKKNLEIYFHPREEHFWDTQYKNI